MKSVRIGDIWVNPRGRRYRVIRFTTSYRCRLYNETFKGETEAYWPIMAEHWTLAEKGSGPERSCE